MNPSPDTRTDLELIAAADIGDRDAFAALYGRYRDWVYAVARRQCGDEHDAADVVQDTFLYLFNKFPGFELRCKLKTFLYPVVRHRAIDLWRKNVRTSALTDQVEDAPAPERRDPPRERAELAERVHGLPPRQCEVVMLRFGDDLELAEIAEVLDVPVGTVKSRLHKALDVLRRQR